MSSHPIVSSWRCSLQSVSPGPSFLASPHSLRLPLPLLLSPSFSRSRLFHFFPPLLLQHPTHHHLVAVDYQLGLVNDSQKPNCSPVSLNSNSSADNPTAEFRLLRPRRITILVVSSHLVSINHCSFRRLLPSPPPSTKVKRRGTLHHTF